MSEHHIFLSYARKDNVPAAPGSEGWVTAFHGHLIAQHIRYAGRPLNIFFDKEEIANGEDWERRIYQGLRSSSLFLAFLSPNYLASPYCRREWEEYLRLEHTLARGDDGIQQIYFVEIPDLFGDDGSLARFAGDLRAWIEDMRRRNLHPGFDLRPWFASGAEQLRELDAADRIAELRANPQSDQDRSIVSLADQIAAIDRAIAQRLDKAILAELAPGNLNASYANFVGRSRELRQLHDALIGDKVGVIGALHGLGGQGKTALALQYAYAYAGNYAAGGRWQLPCEGKRHLAEVLEPLIPLMGLTVPERLAGLTDNETRTALVKSVLDALERRIDKSAPRIAKALASRSDKHSRMEDLPRPLHHALLILDNVDQPELLSAQEMAAVAARPWLQIVITTRLDPREFGGAGEATVTIPVDDLPTEDALALLRRARSFVGEPQAARRIVELLGGFTLGVELVGAYLAVHTDITYAAYLTRLEVKGLSGVDVLAGDAKTAARIRYERQKQIGTIVDDTLATLSDAAREVLAFAALFPPDQIVTDWLRDIVAESLPELALDQVMPGYPNPWAELLRDLDGRRLLPLAAAAEDELPIVRMHRLVSEHLLEVAPVDETKARWGLILGLVQALGAHVENTWPREPLRVLPLIPSFMALVERAHQTLDDAQTALALLILADVELRMGLFVRAGNLLQASHDTLRRLHEQSPADDQAARDMLVSLDRIGDFRVRRGASGDAERALEAYQESLLIRRRLYDDNSGDGQAARDLSVSLNNIGDFRVRRGGSGDAERALEAYQESLQISRRLYDDNSGDGQAARDLSVSLDNIGDFHVRRGGSGDAERALEAYQESLLIRRRLYDDNSGDGQAARDLSVSLDRIGDFRVRRGGSGDAERALEAYQESLQISRRLYDDNSGDGQAARDLSVSLNNIGDFRVRRGGSGDAERALEAYQESLLISRRLYDDNSGDGQAGRDLSVSLNKIGDFHVRRGGSGDAERALEAYQESLQISRRLYDDNSGDGQAARDLSVSLNKIGDFRVRRGGSGDAERALEAYQESLLIRRRLYDDNSGDGQAARDLSVSLNNIGDFRVRRGGSGDAERALEAYQESLLISRRLYDDNSGDGQAGRDLSVSLNKIGDFHVRRGGSGDAERALEAYQESLQISRRLYDDNSGDGQAARDLSVSLNKIGDFRVRRGGSGDAERALEAYQESLQISRRLYDDNSGDGQAARDLSVSLDKIGDFHVRRGGSGDAERALEAYQESLQISRRLYDDNSGDGQAARDLSVSLNKIGDFHVRRGGSGDAERALEAYQESLQISRRLYDDNSGDGQAARDLSVSLDNIGDFRVRRGGSGDAERALEAYQESLLIRRRLYDDNSGDGQAARDLSVSHYLLGKLYAQLRNQALARRAFEQAYVILDAFRREGRPMDEAMRQVSAELETILAVVGVGGGEDVEAQKIRPKRDGAFSLWIALALVILIVGGTAILVFAGR